MRFFRSAVCAAGCVIRPMGRGFGLPLMVTLDLTATLSCLLASTSVGQDVTAPPYDVNSDIGSGKLRPHLAPLSRCRWLMRPCLAGLTLVAQTLSKRRCLGARVSASRGANHSGMPLAPGSRHSRRTLRRPGPSRRGAGPPRFEKGTASIGWNPGVSAEPGPRLAARGRKKHVRLRELALLVRIGRPLG